MRTSRLPSRPALRRLASLWLPIALLAPGAVGGQQDEALPDPWRGVLELQPGGTLWSPSLRGLRLDGGRHEVDVMFSSIPSLKLGLQLETPRTVSRCTLGAGLLFNLEFLSPFGLAEVSTLFKIDETKSLGPQVGLLYFGEPTWYRDIRTRFSDGWGGNAAIQFSWGLPEASLLVTAGYIWAGFDLESDPSFASRSRLDLSGPYVQLGAVLRF